MRIAVVSIPVADQDRAKAFYLDVLGFTELADTSMGPDRRWVMLEPSGGGPAITLVTWFPTMAPGSAKGLVLAVDDIDALHARLSGAGQTVSTPETAPWGRFFTMDDPDGNGLVLQQAPGR